jgi:hypothetical protein
LVLSNFPSLWKISVTFPIVMSIGDTLTLHLFTWIRLYFSFLIWAKFKRIRILHVYFLLKSIIEKITAHSSCLHHLWWEVFAMLSLFYIACFSLIFSKFASFTSFLQFEFDIAVYRFLCLFFVFYQFDIL